MFKLPLLDSNHNCDCCKAMRTDGTCRLGFRNEVQPFKPGSNYVRLASAEPCLRPIRTRMLRGALEACAGIGGATLQRCHIYRVSHRWSPTKCCCAVVLYVRGSIVSLGNRGELLWGFIPENTKVFNTVAGALHAALKWIHKHSFAEEATPAVSKQVTVGEANAQLEKYKGVKLL